MRRVFGWTVSLALSAVGQVTAQSSESAGPGGRAWVSRWERRTIRVAVSRR